MQVHFWGSRKLLTAEVAERGRLESEGKAELGRVRYP